mgnify:CR=1 FL=1
MTEPLITYPCDYPIKVLGDVRPEFYDDVFDVVITHDPEMTAERVSQRVSKKGNFVSISFMLRAVSEQQIADLFEDLKTVASVRMVL